MSKYFVNENSLNGVRTFVFEICSHFCDFFVSEKLNWSNDFSCFGFKKVCQVGCKKGFLNRFSVSET